MATIPVSREFYQHIRDIRTDLADVIFQPMTDEIAGILSRNALNGGEIPAGRLTVVLDAAGRVVDRFLVGGAGRNVYREGGVPSSAFADLLNRHLVEVQYDVIAQHTRYIRRTADGDLFSWLAGWRADPESRRAFAAYEPAHTWLDPNGYQLSDRIWVTGQRSRLKVDAMLTDGIRSGRGALSLSRDLERFLLPTRQGLRTQKPYGTNASYDAMRLARTEITRAHSQASSIAAQLNPWVLGIDFCLSARHPKPDICDTLATVGMGGERLKPPYPKESGYPLPVVSTHPFCLCHIRSVASEAASPFDLKESFEQGNPPPTTPANPAAFLEILLGGYLSGYVTGKLRELAA